MEVKAIEFIVMEVIMMETYSDTRFKLQWSYSGQRTRAIVATMIINDCLYIYRSTDNIDTDI